MNAKMDGGGDRARSMEVFAATVAEGSFSAAGRCLGLTQSADCRTIDRIEARLGKPVISANQALFWAMLDQARIPAGGSGRLFQVRTW